MEVWPDDYLDLIEPAHIAFEGGMDGVFVFGAVKGWLDVRYGTRDGAACAEFSWEGHNDADPASGRGWATLGTAGPSSATSSSTTATIHPSSPSASDFFNVLLVRIVQKAAGLAELGHHPLGSDGQSLGQSG
jgi:hypothetical protein